ncbi:MAG TPA: hypothetical protein VFM05_00200 [Candidatus Saccharimonadales bacterium]|nr:hypothetical protein [Candidatus Saccharimonadales bacterium]
MYAARNKPTPPSNRRRFVIITASLVLLLAAGIAALELTDTTTFFHDRYPNYETAPNSSKRTGGSNTKGESNDNANKEPAPSDQTTDNKDSGAASTSTELLVPSGTFVSNHRPNLDNDPRPNTIQSVCVTTPGASCTILFKKGSTIKQLPVQTTDKEGAAYWTWTLQDIGLAEGNWSIEAKATLHDQVKVAQDPIHLEVSP